MPGILTSDEIQFILEDSKKSIYTVDNLVHPCFTKTHIVKVSKETGLILFYGNSATGYKHIIERHANSTLKPFWKENNKLESPSKFSNEIAPYFYLKLADQIYKPENLNSHKNTSSEVFELYEGESILNGIHGEYRLILYKNTKIINTLYPLSKVANLKLNTGSFARGGISFSYDTKNAVTTLKIPYKDSNDKVVYQIVITYKKIDREKVVTIKKYEDGKSTNQLEIERSIFNHTLDPIYLHSMQYKNFKEYEKKFPKL